jgi:hypothetical protein
LKSWLDGNQIQAARNHPETCAQGERGEKRLGWNRAAGEQDDVQTHERETSDGKQAEVPFRPPEPVSHNEK